MVEINIWATLLAAVSSFMLGGLWYSPVLFGNKWIKETGFEESQAGHPARVFGLSFVFALIAAFAFACLIGPAPELTKAIHYAFMVGVGFVGTSIAINYQFCNKSAALLGIDAGYHIVKFLVFGLILGLWH